MKLDNGTLQLLALMVCSWALYLWSRTDDGPVRDVDLALAMWSVTVLYALFFVDWRRSRRGLKRPRAG